MIPVSVGQTAVQSFGAPSPYFSSDNSQCPKLRAMRTPPIDPSFAEMRAGAAGEYRFYRKSGTYDQQHTGVDLVVHDLRRQRLEDVDVRAIESGVVVYSRYNGTSARDGLGETVIIEHDDDCYSLYAHLALRGVKTGDRLEAGAVIGKLYSRGGPAGLIVPTGNANFHEGYDRRYQLHFALFQSDAPRNQGTIRQRFFERGGKIFGFWISPQPSIERTYQRAPESFDGSLECPPGNYVCSIDDGSAERVIQNNLFGSSSQVQRFMASVGATQPDLEYFARQKVYETSAAAAVVHGQMLSEVLEQCEDSQCLEAFREGLDGILEVPSAESLKSVVVPDEFKQVGEAALKSLGVEFGDDLQLRLLQTAALQVEKGELEPEAFISPLIEYAGVVAIRNADVQQIVDTVVEFQEKANDVLQKVSAAEGVIDNAENLVEAINDIGNGQHGIVSGTAGVISAVNGVVGGLGVLGIDIGDDGRKAVRVMNDVGSIVSIGASLFAGTVNPMAALSGAMQLGGVVGGAKGGPDPWLAGKLSAIDRKLDEVLANQRIMIQKLDELKASLAEMREEMRVEFDLLHSRFDRLEILVNELKVDQRIAGSCSTVDTVVDRMIGLSTSSKNVPSPEIVLPVSDWYAREYVIQFENNFCGDPLTSRSRVCHFHMPAQDPKNCLNAYQFVFLDQCKINSSLVDGRTLADYETGDRLVLHDRLNALAASLGYDHAFEEDDNDRLLSVTEEIAENLSAATLPPITYTDVIAQIAALSGGEMVSLCLSNDVNALQNYRQALANPIREERLLSFVSQALKVFPFVNARHDISSNEVHVLLQKMRYVMEVLLLQKTLESGGVSLDDAYKALRTGKDGVSNVQWKRFREAVGRNDEEGELFRQNLALHVVFSAKFSVLESYDLFFKRCATDDSVSCSVLVKRLDKDAPWTLSAAGEGGVHLRVVFDDDGSELALPLPSPGSTYLMSGEYVLSESLVRIGRLYVALVKYQSSVLEPL